MEICPDLSDVRAYLARVMPVAQRFKWLSKAQLGGTGKAYFCHTNLKLCSIPKPLVGVDVCPVELNVQNALEAYGPLRGHQCVGIYTIRHNGLVRPVNADRMSYWATPSITTDRPHVDLLGVLYKNPMRVPSGSDSSLSHYTLTIAPNQTGLLNAKMGEIAYGNYDWAVRWLPDRGMRSIALIPSVLNNHVLTSHRLARMVGSLEHRPISIDW